MSSLAGAADPLPTASRSVLLRQGQALEEGGRTSGAGLGAPPGVVAVGGVPGAERRHVESRWWRPPRLRAFDVGERHSSWLELFFDLCFVAAVAALASDLHGDPTPGGVLRFAGLFVPVWWAWMGFTWYATAFDTDDAIFRVAMLGAMLAVIGLAASVGSVRNGEATGFVVAYAAMKLLLAALYFRARRYATAVRAYCTRYGAGNALGAAVWLSSLFVPPPVRYGVWALATLILMTSPVLAVRSYSGQPYDAMHIPERYGLFTLIVLGESIVAVSAGTADAGWSPATALTAGAGFGLAACVWWLYFDFVRSTALDRERLLPSFVWGYGQLFIFAGIAAAAVGVELALEAVAEAHAVTAGGAAVLGGGITSYLLAISLIHAVTVRSWDGVVTARLGAAVATVVLASAGPALSPVLLLWLHLAILLGLTGYEMALAAREAHSAAVPVEAPITSEGA